MASQPDLFNPDPAATDSDADRLRNFLAIQKTWCTRAELSTYLSWTERRIRDAAETLGTAIVRSQAGFKLTEQLTRDDIPLAQQSVDAFCSQGKRMIRYAMGLRKRLHSLIG